MPTHRSGRRAGSGLDGVEQGDLLQVDGTVRQILVDTFETEFGYTYDPAIYDSYIERLALDRFPTAAAGQVDGSAWSSASSSQLDSSSSSSA